ncbi:gliding motility-associated lipoprotein GldK [Burkholderia cepacia]|nr:gliding motility-associated lipoprotein GldK [Burkholderia cepacia]KWE18656.1 gliding motility-associated lipoprotein GldK [Burkholderia cepacia]
MVFVEAATFWMGSDNHYPEEQPVRQVKVDSFWIDETPVTNRQFADFVEATGYVTLAETALDPRDYPGVAPELCLPGSAVFHPPGQRVSLSQPYAWWRYVAGANWRHPLGPSSSIDKLDEHPVVHVAYEDAVAYVNWAGKSLPTEAQWELAARGGLDRAVYAWGDALMPDGLAMCNFWHGEFPWQCLKPEGPARTSPVWQFPANGFGIFDMIGNVWEWTDDWYGQPARAAATGKACCVPRNPRGANLEDSFDPDSPDTPTPRKVLKGGSHLCAENYCQRYRPAARIPQTIDTTTSHVGFRCVMRA